MLCALRLDRLNTGPLVAFVRELDPHIIVCTHFMPGGHHLASAAHRRAARAAFHRRTDFDAHAMWLTRTSTATSSRSMKRKRISRRSVAAWPHHGFGIPIDPAFAEQIDRGAACARYELDPKKTTLLVSAGALGFGPTGIVVERLKQLRHDVQTIVVCGRSDALKQSIEAAVCHDRRFRVLGYSERMPELMKMAGLFIGKPGGLTTSEALACGLPMVIISPIPGQEERNSDHLLEDGAALRCNELTTLPYKIDRLLDDPGRLAMMRTRCQRLARPHAARPVAESLLRADAMTLIHHTPQPRACAAPDRLDGSCLTTHGGTGAESARVSLGRRDLRLSDGRRLQRRGPTADELGRLPSATMMSRRRRSGGILDALRGRFRALRAAGAERIPSRHRVEPRAADAQRCAGRAAAHSTTRRWIITPR
jgi:processive 1,2-diacylglycerol beta-glucosyltransferase